MSSIGGAIPEETQELYENVRDGKPHNEEFEESAGELGYREAVDIPVAVMDSWNSSARGVTLTGRSNILAGDQEKGSEPVANIISPDIDHHVLDLIKEDSRFDGYVIRLNDISDLSVEASDQLMMDDFFTTINPYGMHSTTGGSKKWFKDSFWNSNLPIKPGFDLSKVLMNGTDWLDDQYPVDEYVVVPPEGHGGYGIEKTDSAGVVDYVRRVEDGQEIIDVFRAMGHAEGDYGHTLDIRVEPCLPVIGDIRAFVDTDGVLSAYIRFGPEDDFRSNITQMDADNWYDKMLSVYENERAKPFTTEGRKDLEPLPEAVEDLLADTGQYIQENLVGGSEAVMVGADVLVLEKEALEIVPETFHEAIASYSDENHAYVLSEMHGTGGGGQMRYFHDNLEELPVLFEYQKMHELAGLDPAPRENIRSEDHPLHSRLHYHYVDLNQAAHYALETP